MSSNTSVGPQGLLSPSPKSSLLSPQQRDLVLKGKALSPSRPRLALGDVTNNGSDTSGLDLIKSASAETQKPVVSALNFAKAVAGSPSRVTRASSAIASVAGAAVGIAEGIFSVLASSPSSGGVGVCPASPPSLDDVDATCPASLAYTSRALTDEEAIEEDALVKAAIGKRLSSKRKGRSQRAGSSRADESTEEVAVLPEDPNAPEISERRKAKRAEKAAKRCARNEAVEGHLARKEKKGAKKVTKLRNRARATKAAASFENDLPGACAWPSPVTATPEPRTRASSVRSAGIPKASIIPTDVLEKFVYDQPALPALEAIPLTANRFALLADDDEPLPAPVAAPTNTEKKEGFFWRALRFAGNVLATAAAVVTTAVGAVKRSLGWA